MIPLILLVYFLEHSTLIIIFGITKYVLIMGIFSFVGREESNLNG